jgi:peptidoglycan hydrolase-like protein with peptidoglycan-binding domain
MRRNARVAIPAVALLVAAAGGAWWYLPDQAGSEASSATGTQAEPANGETVDVTRGDLTTEDDFTGDVSFGDAWALPLQPSGVVTGSHPDGTVVDPGQELVWVDNRPVFLAQGSLPLYRRLALESPHQKGFDVLQLQSFLLAAGFDDDGRLVADGEFGTATRDAVKDWQDAVGLPVTGQVDGTQVVFSPTPLRIASAVRIGTPFEGLQVTRDDAVVTVDADAAHRDGLPVGQAVEVELPDGTTLPGEVTASERVVAGDGSTSWKVTIAVDGDVGRTETSVLVHSTIVEAADVLIVPTSALLAVANGGFAVELVETGGTRLVPVEVGQVVDAKAEITGDVEAGDQVVVPS